MDHLLDNPLGKNEIVKKYILIESSRQLNLRFFFWVDARTYVNYKHVIKLQRMNYRYYNYFHFIVCDRFIQNDKSSNETSVHRKVVHHLPL